MEAYQTYTPLDWEARENRRIINIAFVSQSALDIRKKLKKLEGFEGKVISELVEIAQKVFQNRDSEGENQKWNRKIKQTVIAEISATNPGPHTERQKIRGARPPLGKNQCAYCKEIGHWKNECPKRKWETQS